MTHDADVGGGAVGPAAGIADSPPPSGQPVADVSVHQHRYRPFGTFPSYKIVFHYFWCRCGMKMTIEPGIPEREWRWAYLTEAGINREWRLR